MKTYTRVLVVFTGNKKTVSFFGKVKLAVFGTYFSETLTARSWVEKGFSFFEFIAKNEEVLEGEKQVARLKKLKGFAGLEIQEVELIDMRN